MLLLTINSYKDEVDEEVVNDVIDICEWQFKVRRMYDPVDSDNKTADMEQRVRRSIVSAGGSITSRELKRNLANSIKKSGITFFQNAVKNLISNGELVSVKIGKAEGYQIVIED